MTMQPHNPHAPNGAHEPSELAPYAPPPTLALQRVAAYMPRNFAEVMSLAKVLSDSGLIKVESTEQAAVVLLTGIELGLSPMQAALGIYNVEGRPMLAADTMKALVIQSGLCESWEIVESTNTTATVRAVRSNGPMRGKPIEATFTVEDAKRRNLIKPKGAWEMQPSIMCLHRAESIVARRGWPDVLLGLYSIAEADEIQGTAEVVSTTVGPKSGPPAAQDWTGRIAAFRERIESLVADGVKPLGEELKAARTAGMPAADVKALAELFQAKKKALTVVTETAPAATSATDTASREPGDEG